jgi:hypothetical protein
VGSMPLLHVLVIRPCIWPRPVAVVQCAHGVVRDQQVADCAQAVVQIVQLERASGLRLTCALLVGVRSSWKHNAHLTALACVQHPN